MRTLGGVGLEKNTYQDNWEIPINFNVFHLALLDVFAEDRLCLERSCNVSTKRWSILESIHGYKYCI